MNTTMRTYLILTSLITLFFVPSAYGHAATYSVTPLVLDYSVQPRDMLTQEITITNVGATYQPIFPTVNNIEVGEGGGITQFLPPSMSDRTNSFSSWIEISRAPIQLAPGEVKKIPLSIHVNPNAVPGKYHAFVSFPTGGNRDEAEVSVLRGAVPGVLVNATLDLKQTESMKRSQFLVKTVLTKPDPEAITISVTNTGDIDLAPKGDVIIYNRRGKEVASIPINPLGEVVKAGADARYTASVPLDGLLGKYKAYLSLSFGTSKGQTIQDTVFFYVLPWKKLLIAFVSVLLLAILLVLVTYYRRRGEVFEDEDHEYLPVHIKESVSDSKEHDIDMKRIYEKDII